MDRHALTHVTEAESDDEVQPSLEYLESVYDTYRTPEGPDWDDIKPRVKRYLQHLFRTGN